MKKAILVSMLMGLMGQIAGASETVKISDYYGTYESANGKCSVRIEREIEGETWLTVSIYKGGDLKMRQDYSERDFKASSQRKLKAKGGADFEGTKSWLKFDKNGELESVRLRSWIMLMPPTFAKCGDLRKISE